MMDFAYKLYAMNDVTTQLTYTSNFVRSKGEDTMIGTCVTGVGAVVVVDLVKDGNAKM
jgi:hypothetical protein